MKLDLEKIQDSFKCYFQEKGMLDWHEDEFDSNEIAKLLM
jgi:hypothetical protein